MHGETVQERGNTMSNNTNTNKPANRPAVFTKKDWDSKTIRAYNGLVMLVKGELSKGKYASMTKAYLYHPVVKELFEKCGIPMEEKQVLSLLFSMVRDRTNDRHIISVSGLRKWFNGGWKTEKPVTYTEPKMPKAPVKKNKTKTVDEIIKSLTPEQVAEMTAKLVA